ncbi:hypothetical protein ACFL5Z_13180 [Planctomycetota bacterium]
MKTTIRETVAFFLVASSVLSLCGGCCSDGSDCRFICLNVPLDRISCAAIGGAIVGGIIGYQSDETGEGIAVGAAICGVGQLLEEIDKESEKREEKHKEERAEQVIVEIHNSNGSITPVKLKKKGDTYMGPKGERYDGLPTEEQLKPIYGL